MRRTPGILAATLAGCIAAAGSSRAAPPGPEPSAEPSAPASGAPSPASPRKPETKAEAGPEPGVGTRVGAAADPGAKGEVIDRVVAVVEEQVITQSELELETRVRLIERGGMGAASGSLDEDTLRAALELTIAQRLQVLEADKLQAFVLEPEETIAAVKAFEARFPSPGAFQAFLASQEADSAQLTSILARGIRAEKLLDSKIQLRAQVSDWEVRRYYDAHPETHEVPFDQLRSALKDKLVRERYAVLAKKELTEMAHAARVRRVAEFARPVRVSLPEETGSGLGTGNIGSGVGNGSSDSPASTGWTGGPH